MSNSSLNNNYTGHSYNSILKGPTASSQFRSNEKVCIRDLIKAYNKILTGEEELDITHLVWRWSEEEDQ